jgi:hemolysin-activating ACP:hemolysin acyltransferase
MALWSKKPKGEKAEQVLPPKPANGSQKDAPRAQIATVLPKQQRAEQMQEQGAASARLLFRLGEVMSVIMRAPQFRTLPLSEVQSLVVPPLASGQFMIAEARSKSQGYMTPVAAALWAKVSKDVDRQLSEKLDQPIRLAPKDWTSGDIPWLIVLAGNAQAIGPMLKKFQDTTLKGQPLKMRAKGKDGKTVVRTFTSGTATPTS